MGPISWDMGPKKTMVIYISTYKCKCASKYCKIISHRFYIMCSVYIYIISKYINMNIDFDIHCFLPVLWSPIGVWYIYIIPTISPTQDLSSAVAGLRVRVDGQPPGRVSIGFPRSFLMETSGRNYGIPGLVNSPKKRLGKIHHFRTLGKSTISTLSFSMSRTVTVITRG